MVALGAARFWVAALHCLAAHPASGAATFCTPRFEGDCLGNLRTLQDLDPSTSGVGTVDVTPPSSPVGIDWNGDGLLDLVVGDGDGRLHYYERTGQAEVSERVGSSNPFDQVRVAPLPSAAVRQVVPAFVDWDGDGDLDLVVGDNETGLTYFERTSAGDFVVKQDDTFEDISVGLSAGCQGKGLKAVAPHFADWDGDGDEDLILGACGGELWYFERLAQTVLKKRTHEDSDPLGGASVGGDIAKPVSVDWDGDGDLDLVVGDLFGKLQYFERVASGTLVLRSGPSSPLQSVRVGGGMGGGLGGAAPAVVDWDADGVLDVIIGTDGGRLHHHTHVAADNLVRRSGPSESPFEDINTGEPTMPVVVDWDGNGVLDLIVGTGKSVHFYRGSSSGAVSHAGSFTGRNFSAQGGADLDDGVAPAVVDWNQDGKLDLVLGQHGGLRYFERATDNELVERTGADSPFSGISPSTTAKLRPAFVDWDGDADLDLVVGADGRLFYFERLAQNQLVPRTGSENPFDFLWEADAYPAFADWDGDGDPDLILGTMGGMIAYYERLPSGEVDRSSTSNPFEDVQTGDMRAAPALGDWDSDQDLDLVVGTQVGVVLFYSRNFCSAPSPCNQRGVCHGYSGTCRCVTGSDMSDCSGCAEGYYTLTRDFPPWCQSCPHDDSDLQCGQRGTCDDDASARLSVGNSSNSTAMVAIGSGDCSCTEPFFYGADNLSRSSCLQGSCPAGFQETLNATEDLRGCDLCPLGRSSAGGGQACARCEPGTYASAPVPDACVPCAPGRFALAEQTECSRCEDFQISSSDRSACELCPRAGEVPNRERTACTACPLGFHATPGASACSFDGHYWALVLVCVLAQGFGLAPLVRNLRRQIRIADISQMGDKVVVTTLFPHGLLQLHSRLTTKVAVAGTAHYLLDNKVFLVRDLSPTRLELLTAEGEPILERIDSSMGVLKVVFPNDLVHMGVFGVPSIVLAALLLPVPWLSWAVYAGSGLLFEERSSPAELQLLLLLVVLLTSFCVAVKEIVQRKRYMRARSPMQRRLVDFRARLATQNPHPRSCERGPGRAVSVVMLGDLLNMFSDFIRDRTAYYLDPNITKPLTSKHKLSFAELAGPRRLVFFVSHFWGTPFRLFVLTIQKHAKQFVGKLSQDDMAYWICFLSNNQWRIADEVGNGDWSESSFYKALRSGSCKATCMVLDDEALPLTRSWCLFEVLQTYRLQTEGLQPDFEGLLYCTNKGVLGSQFHDVTGMSFQHCYDVSASLAKRLARLNVADATASNKDDQAMITRLVEQEGGTEHMNAFVRTNMSRSLEKVRRQFDSEMERLQQWLGGSGSPEVPEPATMRQETSITTDTSLPGMVSVVPTPEL